MASIINNQHSTYILLSDHDGGYFFSQPPFTTNLVVILKSFIHNRINYGALYSSELSQ